MLVKSKLLHPLPPRKYHKSVMKLGAIFRAFMLHSMTFLGLSQLLIFGRICVFLFFSKHVSFLSIILTYFFASGFVSVIN